MKMVPIEADPPGPEFRSSMEDHKRFRAELKRFQSSAPPFLPDSLQRQILAISQGMQARVEAEKVNAAQLREIAESLVGVITAEQGSIPATTDSGQVLVTPAKPQPTGGRLIRGDVDPGPVPSPPAPEPDSKPEPMAYWAGEIAVSVAADGSLLEMVRKALGDSQDEEPKAAVLAVARWFRDRGNSAYAALLEYQADA